jgi:hypothetical protein
MHIVDTKVFIWCHTVSGEDVDRKAGDVQTSRWLNETLLLLEWTPCGECQACAVLPGPSRKRWNHELLQTNNIKAEQRVAHVMKLHSRNIEKPGSNVYAC